MSVKLKAFSYVPAHDEVKWQENGHNISNVKSSSSIQRKSLYSDSIHIQLA